MSFSAVYSNVFLNQRFRRYEHYYELDLRLTEKNTNIKMISLLLKIRNNGHEDFFHCIWTVEIHFEI